MNVLVNRYHESIYWLCVCIFAMLSCANSNTLVDIIDQTSDREIRNINQDWEYLEENYETPHSALSASDWHRVNIPHTWNQWDATDLEPGYRRNASWYKKDIEIPLRNEVIYKLYFEGVNTKAQVFVNGQLAGTHVGGYVGFDIDITRFIDKGKNNQILVRADNGFDRDLIPSQKADFFIYGGIVRDVYLQILPHCHLDDLMISTPVVSTTSAATSIRGSIRNIDPNRKLSIQCQLIDVADDQIVLTSDPYQPSNEEFVINMPKLSSPKLWSPDQPNLYTLRTQLFADGKLLDEKSEAIGYRWFHFEPHGAFYLNGKRLLIRGTHRHEEHAGYGMAVPDSIHRQDMEMIKNMGANFVRLGHYPQDPEVYKMANELGLIIWDELPWCRGGVGEEQWQQNTRRLFEEQIIQNYNHPSIFFWSVGNEVYWLPDFPGGDEPTRINAMVQELNDLAHTLDPDRMTAIRKYYEGSDLVDVFSPSIWSGWYNGVYRNYENALVQSRQKYKHFLHMEYGGSSHIGRHTETPVDGKGLVNEDEWSETISQANVTNIAKSGDWTENYIVDLFDWYLGITERQDWFAGNAQWAFKDFGTPLRPENSIPYINQKGLVDREGKPKDAYYVFKSYWSKAPFVYIESHTWKERSGPKNKKRNISVFSNASSVELLVNGHSQGTKNRQLGLFPACGLNWDITFKEGQNSLVAIGKDRTGEIARDTLTIQYTYQKADKPHRIDLSYQRLEDGNFLVIATMVDKHGQRVLHYEDRCYFTLLDGNSKLYRHYGTPTRSQLIEMANGQACIELKPALGRTVIEARNQDFKGAYLEIEITKDILK